MIPEIQLTTGMIAWISALITIALGLAVKELLVTLVSGLLFRFNKHFNEGDLVYIDGRYAIITKIGFRQTVFEINDDRGHTWLFVYNDRIKTMKLEKVVRSKD